VSGATDELESTAVGEYGRAAGPGWGVEGPAAVGRGFAGRSKRGVGQRREERIEEVD